MMMPIWFLISEQARQELRQFLSLDWQPPRRNGKPVSLDCQMEDVEEIGKIMRQPTKRKRAGA